LLKNPPPPLRTPWPKKHNPATLGDKMIFEDLNVVLSIYGLALDHARYMNRCARGNDKASPAPFANPGICMNFDLPTLSRSARPIPVHVLI
jgi:hypothetical protein